MKFKVIVDRFEAETAVIKFEDGGTAFWPAENLPAGTAEGAVLRVAVETEAEAETNKREQAKNILNEILNTD